VPDQAVDLIVVAWVVFNLGLFTIVLAYLVRLVRAWRSTSLGQVATAMFLVAATVLVASGQRLGIQAARAELIPPSWEEFFLRGYQLALSVIGTIAGFYAITRLRSGIRRIEQGERMIRVLTEGAALNANVSDWGLTARELQVLETIVAGKTSDEEIAEALFIAVSTAATHVRNILRKSGLSSRMDLMLIGGKEEAPDGDASALPDGR
jgi:DNA-binding CsgD family transcriptional regulator